MHDSDESMFQCVRCSTPIRSDGTVLSCQSCGLRIGSTDGILQFPLPESSDDTTANSLFDRLAPIYETPAWFPAIYWIVAGPNPPDDRRFVADRLESGSRTVLDLACGTGRLGRYVADRGYAVIGADRSMGMLTRAYRYADRDGLANITFAQMDATQLWIREDSIETVVCGWALHLFPDPVQVLEQAHNVLRSGGQILGSTIVDRRRFGLPMTRAAIRGTVGGHVFETTEIRTLLRRSGFANVTLECRGAAAFFTATAGPE